MEFTIIAPDRIETVLAELFDTLPPTAAARITSPSARRQRRLDRRDALILKVTAEHYAHLPDGFSRALARDLKAFKSTGFKLVPTLDTPKQAKLRAILDLNDGRALGEKSISNILNGHRTPPAKE
jgi:hypothetical protein